MKEMEFIMAPTSIGSRPDPISAQTFLHDFGLRPSPHELIKDRRPLVYDCP